MEKIRTIFANRHFPTWSPWIGLGLLLAFSFILHSRTLMQYPPPFGDEAWIASRGWSIINSGKNFSSLDAGVVDRFEGYWTFYPWLSSWLLSLSLRPYTQPELFPVRMVSLGFGLLLTIAVYAIGYRLRGHRVGLLSGLLLSLSIPFLISAHLGRPDIYVAALGYSAIAMTVSDKSRFVWKDIAAGLLVGLAFEMHPNASIFVPAVIAGYLLDSRLRILWNKSFWGFCLGVGLGLLYYVWLHILPFPETFFEINKIIFVSTHTPPILSFEGLIQSIKIFSETIFLYDSISIPIIIGMILGFFLEKTRSRRYLYLLGLVILGSFIMLIRNKNLFYIILYAPILYVILTDFLITFLGNFRNERDKFIRYFLICIFIVIYILMFARLLTLYSQGEYAYKNVLTNITQEVKPGDKVLAYQIYWFGLHNHTFFSLEQLLYFNRLVPNATVQDGMMHLRPDIFILDNWVEGTLSDTIPASSYGIFYKLPRDQMNSFLANHARLIKVFEDDTYGEIKIFRIEWSD